MNLIKFILRISVQLSAVFCFMYAASAEARLNVVATTSDIGALAKEVAGDDASVVAIAKGSQDPHFIEAKPSYMVKLRDADLLISNGLSLEIGWLPSLIRGARNPKVNPGSAGHLDLGSLIEPLERPTGSITRAMGDVHPDGNPHFTLDLERDADLAQKIADRMGQLDPAHKDGYVTRAKAFKTRIESKMKDWKARIEKIGIKKVITYHPSLNYFLNRFGIQSPLNLELKPGVPPSAQHILDVIAVTKTEKIKLILVDNFFDTKIADRVAKESPGTRVVSVGIAVESAPNLKTLDDVTEQLVKAFEGK